MLGGADTGATFEVVDDFVNDVGAAVIPKFEIGAPRATERVEDQVKP